MASSSRIFSWEMQEAFASLSGDRNPMHMDSLAARRTQAGQPVAHGVHTLLWALELLAGMGAVEISSALRIKARFLRWVYIGDEVTLVLPEASPDGTLAFRVEVRGMIVLTAELAPAEPIAADGYSEYPSAPDMPRTAPAEPSFASLAACQGYAYLAAENAVRSLFPSLAALLTAPAIAELAACSYVVGMEIPGLYSMFSSLGITVQRDSTSAAGGLFYRTLAADERFGKVRITVTGRCVRGSLVAFARLPPVAQRSIQDVAGQIDPGEFAGMTALIVGGSRGLGELTAKMIAAGGGTPMITYSVGLADAEKVRADIVAWGGNAQVMQYDVRRPPANQLAALTSRPSHLFYFATNAIFRPKERLVSTSILADFTVFYLTGFHDMCLQILQQFPVPAGSEQTLGIYYPSSIAVEQRPNGMTEYAMVKAAGEQMCRDMNQYLPGLRILTSRLPRLPTDQTASIVPGREQDPLAVMLPILRQMKAPA
jgi:acyl dehydratase/NADP-dependent 3-hydroxy acid dehydrogenase YdfG